MYTNTYIKAINKNLRLLITKCTTTHTRTHTLPLITEREEKTNTTPGQWYRYIRVKHQQQQTTTTKHQREHFHIFRVCACVLRFFQCVTISFVCFVWGFVCACVSVLLFAFFDYVTFTFRGFWCFLISIPLDKKCFVYFFHHSHSENNNNNSNNDKWKKENGLYVRVDHDKLRNLNECIFWGNF